jgi:hypothetical protein
MTLGRSGVPRAAGVGSDHARADAVPAATASQPDKAAARDRELPAAAAMAEVTFGSADPVIDYLGTSM